jgi:hypothetical protein
MSKKKALPEKVEIKKGLRIRLVFKSVGLVVANDDDESHAPAASCSPCVKCVQAHRNKHEQITRPLSPLN